MSKYQEALNKLKHRGERFGQDLYDTAKDEIDTLQELIDQNKPLTLDECIKEWEELGYMVDINAFFIHLNHKRHHISLFINKEKKVYHIYYGYISLELNELISKTLKALEEMKND